MTGELIPYSEAQPARMVPGPRPINASAKENAMLMPNSLEGKAAPLLKRIENLHEQIESERGAFMKRCRELRDDVREILEEGKGQGIAPKALRALIKFRALERRQQAIGDGLDIADQSDYESLVAALGDFGDTELGKAVIETAKAKAASGSTTPGKPKGPPDAVKARTAEEIADAPEEVTEQFSKRLAEANQRGDAMARGEAIPPFN